MRHKLETQYGTLEVRNCIIDIDGYNLEEGCEIWLNGAYEGEFVGLDIDENILNPNAIPYPYTKEDYRMQIERFENAIEYGYY